jgi:predicted DNA-binding transcriptional regulator AlpA
MEDNEINLDKFERPLTAKEVMPLLGYRTRCALWAAVHREGIPYLRVSSRKIVFPRAALQAWINHRTVGRVAA